MKIGLNMDGNDANSVKAAESRALERIIIDAKKGDWNAKEKLIQKFRPLIISLIEKRTKDSAKVNDYMDAAKAGLITAAGKYSSAVGADNFHVFALTFIEKSMDRRESGGGFFSRLFGFKNK
ncbi:MAG: hypothetical protein WCN95_05340 [bacterium]